jgi:hypothetical protein
MMTLPVTLGALPLEGHHEKGEPVQTIVDSKRIRHISGFGNSVGKHPYRL